MRPATVRRITTRWLLRVRRRDETRLITFFNAVENIMIDVFAPMLYSVTITTILIVGGYSVVRKKI
jgi:hypothetical protein